MLNAAARLVYSSRRYDHVMPLLRELHWLRMSQRIDHKLAVLVYRCLNGLAPSTLPTTSSVWRTSTPGGVFARHQRVHSSSLWRACQQSETARFRWPRLACGTVCRPMSLRRHRCRHSRDGLRQNCLFGAIHSSAASDTLFFTARAARTSFRFSSFFFCKVS